jgi:SPP1 gp7 family putative phage head morphogenesis protein
MMIKNNLSEVTGMTDYMKNECLRILSIGIMQGSGVPKISRELTDKINISRDSANRIVRTEVIRGYNQAAMNRYKQAGIEQWSWITCSDDRACEECLSLDETIHDMGDDQPPIHVNCRCSVACYIPEENNP